MEELKPGDLVKIIEPAGPEGIEPPWKWYGKMGLFLHVYLFSGIDKKTPLRAKVFHWDAPREEGYSNPCICMWGIEYLEKIS